MSINLTKKEVRSMTKEIKKEIKEQTKEKKAAIKSETKSSCCCGCPPPIKTE